MDPHEFAVAENSTKNNQTRLPLSDLGWPLKRSGLFPGFARSHRWER